MDKTGFSLIKKPIRAAEDMKSKIDIEAGFFSRVRNWDIKLQFLKEEPDSTTELSVYVNEEDPSDSDGSPGTDTLSHTVEETRAYINLQSNTYFDTINNAMKVIRLNLLITGLVLTAGALLVPSSSGQTLQERISMFGPYTSLNSNPPLYAGFGALIFSVIFAFWTFRRSSTQVGLQPDHVNRVLSGEYDEQNFLYNLASSHESWIADNQKVGALGRRLLSFSHASLALGVGYFVAAALLGSYISGLPDGGSPSLTVLVLSLLIPIAFPIIILSPPRRLLRRLLVPND